MHLIAPLVSGIRGAENGFVTFFQRGTTIVANYYADFEATQLLLGQTVPLDSYGALEAYVAELVTVQVKDALGVVLREFVAGDEDAAVEVISPSFTGIDHTSGASGVQKPTTLDRVLDSWVTSAGAPDWNVLVNGVSTTIQVLAGNAFFNVKSYGAQGNGVSDDSTAIAACNAAATAAGGGNVYFPPGTYRVTTTIALPANVTWIGGGGLSTKLAIDSAVGSGAVALPAGAPGSISTISGMWIGAINGALPGVLIEGAGGATGEFHLTDSVLGNDAVCNNFLYSGGVSSAFKGVITRCYLKASTGSVPLIRQAGSAGRLVVRDCDLISAQAFPGDLLVVDDGAVIEGNRFDGTAGTLGTFNYIRIAPTTFGNVTIVGNQFAPNLTVTPTAIYNSLAVPTMDAFEACNSFGDYVNGPLGIIPYGYTTDGYAGIGGAFYAAGHQSRIQRTEVFQTGGGAQTVNPKAFGTSIVRKLGGAAITLNASTGSMGDQWTLHIINSSGGALTVTPGTNIIFDAGVTGGTLVVTNNGFSECILRWLPTAGGVGNWFLTSKAVTT